ncbi:HPr family phosphocarrier protein [Burkholderia ubonensis]|nr:HPr family phosphocarrier protein [Burkholderia ubonensis]
MATVVHLQVGSGWNRNRAYAAQDALVDMARRFESDILLIANGRRGNAKDGMAIASLQVRGGTSAQVLAAGPDEEAALQALLPLLQERCACRPSTRRSWGFAPLTQTLARMCR